MYHNGVFTISSQHSTARFHKAAEEMWLWMRIIRYLKSLPVWEGAGLFIISSSYSSPESSSIGSSSSSSSRSRWFQCCWVATARLGRLGRGKRSTADDLPPELGAFVSPPPVESNFRRFLYFRFVSVGEKKRELELQGKWFRSSYKNMNWISSFI